MTDARASNGQRAPMRFAVDAWDANYGTSLELEPDAESSTTVDAAVERDVADWAPIPPTPVAEPAATIFVDGVRRIEARIWIDEVPAEPGQRTNEASVALVASYAAGWVCCCGRAHIGECLVRRGLFTTAQHASDVVTRHGTYAAFPTTLNPVRGLWGTLSAALQYQLSSLEIAAAVAARAGLAEHGIPEGADLLVVDGPVRGREGLARVLGFIKSHQIAYLEPALHAMIGTLGPGERTPVFLLGTKTWNRFTWYLRLPCLPGQPWAGVARVECAANLPAPEAIALANQSQAVLPRFASVEYKDPRAPQNLYPVAGLERELRRRMGSAELLYRALLRAAVESATSDASATRIG